MLTIRPSFRRLIWPPLMGKYLCMERFREMGQQLIVRLDQSKKFIVNLKYIFCFHVDKIVLIYLKKRTKLDTVNPLNLQFFCELIGNPQIASLTTPNLRIH